MFEDLLGRTIPCFSKRIACRPFVEFGDTSDAPSKAITQCVWCKIAALDPPAKHVMSLSRVQQRKHGCHQIEHIAVRANPASRSMGSYTVELHEDFRRFRRSIKQPTPAACQ